MKPAFYFDAFEARRPFAPLPHSRVIEAIWHVLAVCSIVTGAVYIVWRWTHSLNFDALWFAIPLAIAETCAWFGLILFTANLWRVRDYPRLPPPASIDECVLEGEAVERPVSVDLFIATYNEEEELVRLSVRDAKAITYPHPVDLCVYVLDDGRRASMKAVCDEEGVGYISRDNADQHSSTIRNQSVPSSRSRRPSRIGRRLCAMTLLESRRSDCIRASGHTVLREQTERMEAPDRCSSQHKSSCGRRERPHLVLQQPNHDTDTSVQRPFTPSRQQQSNEDEFSLRFSVRRKIPAVHRIGQN